jgi:D-alanyl-D-alanine carboxypeptidase
MRQPAAFAVVFFLLVWAFPTAAAAKSALDREMAALVRMPGGPPGVAVVIQRGSKPQFRTAGVSQLGTAKRWRPGDRMRLASTSKAFSGGVALSLAAAGKLSLDASIGSILPWLPQDWQRVTVAQALNHTSGLPDYSSSKRFLSVLVKDFHAYFEPRQLLGYVAKEPLRFAPGSDYKYSNTDNVVIGLIAEAVDGHPYRQVLEERVYDPLGLKATTLPRGYRLSAPFVHGYDVDPPAAPEDVSTLFGMSSAWASGGIASSAADLNRFIRGYLGDRLFGPAEQDRQLRFVAGESDPPGPGANAAGLAVFRYSTPCGTVYGHTGNIFGYTQFAAASRGGERSVTVSVNGQITPGAKNPAVRRAFAALRQLEARAVCAALAGR